MNAGQAWKILGIGRTSDVGAVRRAYADKLKASNPDSDPAAYAALRDARDMALRIARQLADKAAVPDASEAELSEESAAASWALAAPLIEPASAAPGLSTSAPTTVGTMRPITVGFAEDFDPEDKALGGDPWAVPALAAEQASQPDQLVMRLAPADQRLWNLLYANGHEDTAQLDDTELIAARTALRDVLADAAGGSLTQHEVIEDWLANTLAGSWPRCAPLLEEAATFFGWEREAGKLGERHSVAFLNARAKGLRFHRKVLDPKHLLHKAWVELQRDGRANMFDRLRTSKHDVKMLLDGIRKNFPEMEDHLDPQRVGSWEGAGGSAGTGKVQGPGRWIWALGAFVVLRLIIAIGDMSTSKPSPMVPQMTTSEALNDPTTRTRIEGIVTEVFGTQASADWLQQHQPILMQEIAARAANDAAASSNPKSPTIDAALKTYFTGVVRQRLYENSRQEAGDVFDSTMRLRLAQLREAKALGTEKCSAFLKSGDVGSAVLSADLRQRERNTAKTFAESSRLTTPAPRQVSSASVPGALVGKVMERTGLTQKQVADAMQNKGSEAQQCSVTVALLEATLAWQGKERTAILKTL